MKSKGSAFVFTNFCHLALDVCNQSVQKANDQQLSPEQISAEVTGLVYAVIFYNYLCEQGLTILITLLSPLKAYVVRHYYKWSQW